MVTWFAAFPVAHRVLVAEPACDSEVGSSALTSAGLALRVCQAGGRAAALAPVGFDRGPWGGQFAADLDPGEPACFHPASSDGLAAADFGPACLASQACSDARTDDPA